MSGLLDAVIEAVNKNEHNGIHLEYKYRLNNMGEHVYSFILKKGDNEPSVVRLAKSTLSIEEAEEVMVASVFIDGINSLINLNKQQ